MLDVDFCVCVNRGYSCFLKVAFLFLNWFRIQQNLVVLLKYRAVEKVTGVKYITVPV